VQAVQVLLSQGENAQASQYKEWLEGSCMHMPPGKKTGKLRRLSPGNRSDERKTETRKE